MVPRLVLLALILMPRANSPRLESRLRDGDIIFHESRSSQSRSIQLATKSRYSHMGIVYRQNAEWFVYEAVQPVKLTPLHEWTKRGRDGHFVVKRLRHPEVLTPAVLKKMRAAGEKFRGKPYDLYFEWDDRRIYCSELVWKIYKEAAGIEIGGLQRLKEFDLSAGCAGEDERALRQPDPAQRAGDLACGNVRIRQAGRSCSPLISPRDSFVL